MTTMTMTATMTTTMTTRARTTTRANACRRAPDASASTDDATRRRALAMMMTSSLVAVTSAREARAYGTGGWRDCQPVCDSLKNGREEQLRLQREMMASMGEDASASADASDAKKDAVEANGGRIPRKKKK